MGKPPSDATLLRQARSELNEWKRRAQRAEMHLSLETQRANKAEADSNQWQRRFDSLVEAMKQPRNT